MLNKFGNVPNRVLIRVSRTIFVSLAGLITYCAAFGELWVIAFLGLALCASLYVFVLAETNGGWLNE